MVTLPRPQITVFGCTGNAGRAVAYHCIRISAIRRSRENDDDCGGARPPSRIALAGRNRDKVARVLEGIRDELRLEGLLASEDDLDVNILIADVTDHISMLSMAKSSNVVISCAGPYGRYGEACVKACVLGGAHYVDITGEVPFVERMIADYGGKAIDAGITLCPFAGYDCVPAELGMWLVGKALEMEGNGARLGTLALNFGGKGGGFPRGTLNTILDGVEGKGTARRDGDPRFYLEEYRDVAKSALSLSNFAFPKYQMGQFTGPNFMSVVNVPVLCRSAPTVGFTSELRISDRASIVSIPSWQNGYGLFGAQVYIAILFASGMASMIGPFRSWLRHKLETGYSYHGDPSAHVRLDVMGSSTTNDGMRATANCVFPGDPGIYATGLFAAGVAGALLEATTSPDPEFSMPLVGFNSPVAALHVCRPGLLVDHLEAMGAHIKVELIQERGAVARAIDVSKLRSKL
jgi:short subunit dehydrogenase-like uncharacterized protein